MNQAIEEFDQLCQEYLTAIYHNATGFINYEPGEKEEAAKDKIFLTYGELLYPSVNALIDYMDISENDVFYDFGSGIGKVGLQFFLKTPVKKVVGIEFSEKRHVVAEQVFAKVKEEFPELFLNNRELKSICGNFLEIDISDATIIYSCSTCFSEELLADMGQVFNRCPKLRYVASMKPIPFKYPLNNILEVDCSWDKSSIHIYSPEADGS